jgi:hypothetical protein
MWVFATLCESRNERPLSTRVSGSWLWYLVLKLFVDDQNLSLCGNWRKHVNSTLESNARLETPSTKKSKSVCRTSNTAFRIYLWRMYAGYKAKLRMTNTISCAQQFTSPYPSPEMSDEFWFCELQIHLIFKVRARNVPYQVDSRRPLKH